jgi:hypothetical protein
VQFQYPAMFLDVVMADQLHSELNMILHWGLLDVGYFTPSTVQDLVSDYKVFKSFSIVSYSTRKKRVQLCSSTLS